MELTGTDASNLAQASSCSLMSRRYRCYSSTELVDEAERRGVADNMATELGFANADELRAWAAEHDDRQAGELVQSDTRQPR